MAKCLGRGGGGVVVCGWAQASAASYRGSTKSMGCGSSLGMAWGGCQDLPFEAQLEPVPEAILGRGCSLHLVFPLPPPALVFWPLVIDHLVLHQT